MYCAEVFIILRREIVASLKFVIRLSLKDWIVFLPCLSNSSLRRSLAISLPSKMAWKMKVKPG